MNLRVRPYEAGADDAAWDRFVAQSLNGTILHTRRFLSYHGERFVDRSLVIEDDRQHIRGVLPAALDRSDERVVVSHPGITFGGLVHDGALQPEVMITTMEDAAELYRAGGARTIRYKAVPSMFHRVPASEDLYALFRLGAQRVRCDVAATIDLGQRLPLRRRRVRWARTAQRMGVEARWGWDAAPEFWHLLGDVLGQRHGVTPVHNLEEIQLLASRFPDEIRLVTSWMDGVLVAGGVTFTMGPVVHVQYSASSPVGREAGAYDVMVEAGISAAIAGGHRYYDFGISTEKEGWLLNSSLHDFKVSFGAGATVFEHYEVAL